MINPYSLKKNQKVSYQCSGSVLLYVVLDFCHKGIIKFKLISDSSDALWGMYTVGATYEYSYEYLQYNPYWFLEPVDVAAVWRETVLKD